MKSDFISLPVELQRFFMVRFVLSVGIALLLLFTNISPSAKVFGIVIALLFLVTVLCSFKEVLEGKYFAYDGVCVEKIINVTDAPKSLRFLKEKVYGRCYIVLSFQEDGKDEVKCVVPIHANFKGNVGNTIRFYARKEDIYQDGDNYCTIDNPLTVVVAKL